MELVENIQATSALLFALVILIAWVDREATNGWLGENCHKTITALLVIGAVSPFVFLATTMIRIWS